MKLKDIFRLFRRNLLWIIIFPIMLASCVFYLTGKTKKKYTSDFIIYTGIASGYKLTSEENPRVDFYLVNNAFDNLMATMKARETLEEVGMRLLAFHLVMDTASPGVMTVDSYNRLKELLPYAWRKTYVDSTSEEITYQNLKTLKESSGKNIITTILNSDGYTYGVWYIRNGMSCKRKDNSDMLEIYYTSEDPAVSQKTLYILADVFFGKFKTLKESEINRVVKYFSDKADANRRNLKAAENNLKNFGQKYKIINFDEQVSHITSSRKELHSELDRDKLLLAATQAAFRRISEKLQGRNELIENNHEIVEKRKLLSELNHKIAGADIKKVKGNELLNLKNQADALRGEIKNLVKKIYKLNNTEEGIGSDVLLDQYLSNLLLIDETTAKIDMMDELDNEYEKLFNDYAPLGAMLSALERDVKVAENEYMLSTSALNTNLQKQQNLSLNANLKMVDFPIYPNKADKDKRMALVMGGWFAGFILVLGYLLGKMILNDMIRTPSRAERVSGLEVAGIFPLIPTVKAPKYDFESLENSFSEQCAGALILSTKNDSRPSKIIVTGTRPGEGKVRVSSIIACKLSEINGKILLLYPSTEKIEVETFLKSCRTGVDRLVSKEYSIGSEFVEMNSFESIIKDGNLNQFDFVITVIPSLSESKIPVGLLKGNVLPVLVINAGRSWTDSDSYFLKLFSKACSRKPMALLNKVSTDALEDLFGKIPGRRALPKGERRFQFKRFRISKTS